MSLKIIFFFPKKTINKNIRNNFPINLNTTRYIKITDNSEIEFVSHIE